MEDIQMTEIELWDLAQPELRNIMSSVAYRTFVEDKLMPVQLDGQVMTFVVSSDHYKTTITKRYISDIERALACASGKTISIEVLNIKEWDERTNTLSASPAAEPATVSVSMPLMAKYTFDTFIVGNSNRFAHAASVAVAESPAEAYNPLFIYGGAGLGKTHLMHAIGHHIRQQQPDAKLIYITSENFTNELIKAIQEARTAEFRESFRNVDVLMVDDIQFIAGRDSTQEEFFHTFNALHQAGKQIIMTSDKPPKEIARLEERLCSRFEWGLIADIQRPDIDTRIAILRNKAQADNIQVKDEVLQMIAEHVDSNIRELEGSLTRLVAYASLAKMPISTSLCEEALKEVFSKSAPRRITAEVVIEAVCAYYSLKTDELTGSARRREIVTPRHIAMYLTREMVGLSLPQIGKAFGNRDHSTVIHACEKIETGLKINNGQNELTKVINDIRQSIREGK